MSLPLILASGSRTRLALLTAAGLSVTAIPAAIDEDAVKSQGRAKGQDAAAVALALAEVKARAVSKTHPDALVIGADQMLACQSQWFDKPADRTDARRQLLILAGQTHRLLTAVAVCRGDQTLWRHGAVATLTMRSFTEAFVDDYLSRAGDAPLSSVGAYQLEGLGVQLFDKIEGDHFTILGLPLLPLLAFLRQAKVLMS
jgi:septum formation protein